MKTVLMLLTILLASALPACAANWSKIANEVYQKHFAMVALYDEEGKSDGFCSAVQVRKDEWVTAAHCWNAELDLVDPLGASVEAEVEGWVMDLDLLLLKAHLPGKTPIALATGVRIAEDVLAIGVSRGPFDRTVHNSVTAGMVTQWDEDFIVMDHQLYHGMSGGPMVNDRGELVGINDRTNDKLDYGVSIPVSRVSLFLHMLDVGMKDKPEEAVDDDSDNR